MYRTLYSITVSHIIAKKTTQILLRVRRIPDAVRRIVQSRQSNWLLTGFCIRERYKKSRWGAPPRGGPRPLGAGVTSGAQPLPSVMRR